MYERETAGNPFDGQAGPDPDEFELESWTLEDFEELLSLEHHEGAMT